jgi:hypothetical protein
MPPVTITQERTLWGQYHGQKIPEKLVERSEYSFSTDGSQAECSWPGTDDLGLNVMMCKVHRADGVIAALHPATKTIYATRSGESGRGRQEEFILTPLPEKSCLANELGNERPGRLVGESNILGFRVFEIEDPAQGYEEGAIYQTDFRAPDLNCFSLRRVWRHEKTHNGVLDVSNNETRTVSIVPGEPDPARFRLPADWRRVKPSSVFPPGADVEKLDADWAKSHYDGE